jgi:membrane protein implicated in regulation of membrane protease activity
VLAVAIGWFAPLFGVSLLSFLVVDAVLGRRRVRRVSGPERDVEPVESVAG